jgi:hypothetical protein
LVTGLFVNQLVLEVEEEREMGRAAVTVEHISLLVLLLNEEAVIEQLLGVQVK